MTSSRDVLSRLSWSLGGGLAAAGLLFAGTIVAARQLGPAQYGVVAFGVAAAQLLSILVMHGMDFASSRAIARSGDANVHTTVVSTSLVAVAVVATVLVVLGWPLAAQIGAALDASPTSIRGAVGLLGIYGLKAVMDRQLAALKLVAFQARAKPIEGIVVLAGIALLVLLDRTTAAAVLALFGAATLILVGVYLVRLRGLIRRQRVRLKEYRGLLPFARVSLASSLVPLPLLFADKLAVQFALPPHDLGVYMAYLTSSVLVSAQLLALVNNVLFPTVAATSDMHSAFDRVRRAVRFGFVPFALGCSAFVVAMLQLFGGQYAVHLPLVLGFSALASLQFCNGLVHIVVMAHSRKAFASEVRWSLARSVAFCAYLLALIQSDRVTLMAVVLGLIGCELAELLVLRLVLHSALESPPSGPEEAIPGTTGRWAS